MQPGKRVSFHTLGCKLNYSESSSLAGRFEQRGYTVVPFGDPSDLIVINTCTVTENADVECRKIIRRGLKGAPGASVAVTGCYAQLQPEEIASIDGVKAVFGTAEKLSIADRAEEILSFDTPQIFVAELGAETTFMGSRTTVNDSRTRAFLKLQDGCDYSCTFCTIPIARGPARAMPFHEIEKHVRLLESDGFHEVVLTGINLGEYKAPTGERFVDVLDHLQNLSPQFRVRISSIEPNTLTDDIIDLTLPHQHTSTQAHSLFCPHFHIPLQSGSADILRRMKRRYNPDMYRRVIEKIFDKRADAALGIDVIVGFPGETEEHFNETVRFLESLPFTYLHVFTYSERENTPAASYADRVPMQIRKERTALLRELSEQRRMQHYHNNLGTIRSVLPESYDMDAGGWYGWTENYVRVLYKASQLIVNGPKHVLLTELHDDVVVGIDHPQHV